MDTKCKVGVIAIIVRFRLDLHGPSLADERKLYNSGEGAELHV